MKSLTNSQQIVLSMIEQGLSSSKAGTINKRTAKSLIKLGLIKMSNNEIDYEIIKKVPENKQSDVCISKWEKRVQKAKDGMKRWGNGFGQTYQLEIKIYEEIIKDLKRLTK